jgi:hypothetical protein
LIPSQNISRGTMMQYRSNWGMWCHARYRR